MTGNNRAQEASGSSTHGRPTGTRRDSAPASSAPSLQVLDRAFAILDTFDQARPTLTTTELSRLTGLPVPTVHRLVVALEGHDYLSRDPGSKRFRLGTAALNLGQRARTGLELIQVARPFLLELTGNTDETALLVVPDPLRQSGVCIERVESSSPLRLSVEPGTRLPLHSGASQTAILAFMSVDEIETVLGRLKSDSARAAVRRNLRRIRDSGIATSVEETDIGTWGLAVPLLDGDERPVASLGVAAPTARATRRAITDSIAAVAAAAGQIATSLELTSPEIDSADAQARLKRKD